MGEEHRFGGEEPRELVLPAAAADSRRGERRPGLQSVLSGLLL